MRVCEIVGSIKRMLIKVQVSVVCVTKFSWNILLLIDRIYYSSFDFKSSVDIILYK